MNEGQLVPATTNAAPTIFSADPRQVVELATDVAKVLGKLLKDRGLVSNIRGREYVVIEGWTLLGSMVGVFAQVDWTRPISDADGVALGWESRASAYTVDGRRISAAEAMCGRDEGAWRNRDDYALRSMAQTRAVSKALRLPLGFIVSLAGYAATPAEELPADDLPARPLRSRSRGQEAAELRQAIEARRLALGMDTDELAAMAREHGVEAGTKATLAQLRAIHDRLLTTALQQAGMPPGATVNDLPDLPDVPEVEDATNATEPEPTEPTESETEPAEPTS